LRIELLGADGAVLAQSETRLSISADLAEEKTLRPVMGQSLRSVYYVRIR
jgi:hypothetical protein